MKTEEGGLQVLQMSQRCLLRYSRCSWLAIGIAAYFSAIAHVSSADETNVQWEQYLADQMAALSDRKGEGRLETIRRLGSLRAYSAGTALAGILNEGGEAGRAARDALVRIGPACVEDILRVLRDGREPARILAAEVLREIPDRRAVPLLLSLFRAGSVDARLAASEALCRMPTKEATLAFERARKSDDPGIRLLAIGYLAHIAPEKAVRALVASLGDPDEGVRRQVLSQLEFLDGAASAVVGALGEMGPRAQVEAALLLGRIGDATCILPLIRLARSTAKQDVREYSMTALSMLAYRLGKEPKALPKPVMLAVLNMMRAGDTQCMTVVASLLAATRRPEAVGQLQKLLVDRRAEVRCAAVNGLGRIAGSRMVHEIAGCLADKNLSVRHTASEVLVRIGPTTSDVVGEYLQNRDAVTRRVAAITLGRLGDPRAYDPLMNALARWREEDVGNVIGGLEKIADRKAVRKIAEVFRKSKEFRQDAAEALGRIGDPVVVEDLVDALNGMQKHDGKRPEVLTAVIVASLGALGDARATPVLVKVMEEDSGLVRRAAARALGQIRDPRAIEALRQHWQRDPFVREAAGRALLQIGREAVPIVAKGLYSGDQATSRTAAALLEDLGGSEGIRILCDALWDWYAGPFAQSALWNQWTPAGDEDRVAWALAARDQKALVADWAAVKPALVSRLRGGCARRREMAAVSLVWIGHDDAIGPLIAALEREGNPRSAGILLCSGNKRIAAAAFAWCRANKLKELPLHVCGPVRWGQMAQQE